MRGRDVVCSGCKGQLGSAEWVTLSVWLCHLAWLCPLAAAEGSWENASRALEGVTPIQSKLHLVLGVRIGVNDPPDTFLKDYSFLIDRPVPAFPVLPVISQPCSVGVLRAQHLQIKALWPPTNLGLGRGSWGLPQNQTKPHHPPAQNFNVTSQVSLVFHSYCRSCIEWN